MNISTQSLSDQHAAWLEKRGITREIAALADLKTINGNLAFPYYSKANGDLLYNKIRYQRPEGKSFMRDRKGVPTALYWPALNVKGAPWLQEIIITEGEIDALSAVQAGHPNVCSVPDGAQRAEAGTGDIIPIEDKTYSWLWNNYDLVEPLKSTRRIILAVDNDDKGLVLRSELSVRLGPDRCYFVTYPEGCKDLNEVLVKYGPAEVDRVIIDALPMQPDKLVKFSQIAKSKDKEYVLSGWPVLDEHLRINFPELVVVTGSPGSGKSQWALSLVANIAAGYGIRSAVLQFEDSVERNRRDLYNYAQYFKKHPRFGHESTVEQWVDDHFVTIKPAVDEDDDYTLDWLKQRVKEACIRQGCRIILIDPWNEIEHAFNVRETETAYTNNALRELKKLGRRYECVIIVVTHPSKGISGKPFEDQSMYDISGSAAWKNKCDHGIILHRDKSAPDNETWLKVDKAKDHATMGTPGQVKLGFDHSIRYFTSCYKFPKNNLPD